MSLPQIAVASQGPRRSFLSSPSSNCSGDGDEPEGMESSLTLAFDIYATFEQGKIHPYKAYVIKSTFKISL